MVLSVHKMLYTFTISYFSFLRILANGAHFLLTNYGHYRLWMEGTVGVAEKEASILPPSHPLFHCWWLKPVHMPPPPHLRLVKAGYFAAYSLFPPLSFRCEGEVICFELVAKPSEDFPFSLLLFRFYDRGDCPFYKTEKTNNLSLAYNNLQNNVIALLA